jgi:hypothetical protein
MGDPRRPRNGTPRQYDHTSSTTPITIIAMPTPSRAETGCLNTKREIAWPNSTSTSASVRTLAAVASAKARNQNWDAVAA